MHVTLCALRVCALREMDTQKQELHYIPRRGAGSPISLKEEINVDVTSRHHLESKFRTCSLTSGFTKVGVLLWTDLAHQRLAYKDLLGLTLEMLPSFVLPKPSPDPKSPRVPFAK